MPELGEIKEANKLGYKGIRKKYIWQACEVCHKERWVQLRKGQPVSTRCIICAAQNEGVRKKKSEAHRMEKNSHWQGGKIKLSGYVFIKLSPDSFFHSMADKRGYVREHRLVMAQSLGRCLQPWEIVHHKGVRYKGIRNRSDNLRNNLQLVSDDRHSQLTILGNKIDKLLEEQKGLKQEIRLLRLENKLLKEEIHKYGVMAPEGMERRAAGRLT